MDDTGRLYFRQLRAGRDFAADDPTAVQMVNFVYLVGDRDTGDCLVVDPAYAIDELLALVDADGMHVAGVIATHYHPDHIGGALMAGHLIEGVPDLLERVPCPVHVQGAEVPWVSRTIGLSESELTAHGPGDTVAVGEVEVTLLHTPGHTPGSQCVLVDGMVLTGDTLFLDGCGRTDFPGGDPEVMYDSLQRLAALPDGTVVYPGHHYSPPSRGTIETVRQQNYVYQPRSKAEWLTMLGR